MTATGPSIEAHGAFRFAVKIGNDEATFTECTLPALEVDVLEQKEGGHNQRVHLIAGAVKAGRLILKRGVASPNALLKWYMDVASGNLKNVKKNVSVVMFDSAGAEVIHLDFVDAYPVKWSGPAFKASDNVVAIETLELAFAEFKQQK